MHWHYESTQPTQELPANRNDTDANNPKLRYLLLSTQLVQFISVFFSGCINPNWQLKLKRSFPEPLFIACASSLWLSAFQLLPIAPHINSYKD